VIAAGFDGGTPSYKAAEPARKVMHQATAPSVAPSSPAPVATQAVTTPPPRRVLFDDVDVPDFLKNGS
jgi:cell division protein FtsZ